jgi:hypothetical protein
VPHKPHELRLPVQVGPSLALPVEEAKTESFFESFGEPQ